MDRGPMMFTSDVSLPKDDKTAMQGKKLQLGNGQDYGRKPMLTMLQERKRLKSMDSTPRKVDRNPFSSTH